MNTIASPTLAKHDIVEAALAAGHFSTFSNAIKVADLTGALKGNGPFTVFAPTDEAFKKLPQGELEALLKDKIRLTSMVKSHVLPSKLLSKDITTRQSKTLEGNSLDVVNASGGVSINESKVTTADIETTNGVIHAIDTVITQKH
jgi:uncharacterized surface protein with fasciclin (FAS1) repeats